MEYNAMMIARTEHENMIRSLQPVSENDAVAQADMPGWVSVQAGQLLYVVGNGLAALGERLKDGQDAGLETSQERQKHQSLSN